MARRSKSPPRSRARANNPAALRAAQAALVLAPLVSKFDDLQMDAERRALAATIGKTRYGARVLAAHDKATPYRKATGRALSAAAQHIRDFKPFVSEVRQVHAAFKNPRSVSRRVAMLLSDAFGPLPDWADDLRGRVRGWVGAPQGYGPGPGPGPGKKAKRPPARRNPPLVGQQVFVKGKPAVVVAFPAPGTKGRVQVRFHRTGALMSVTPASAKTVPPKGKK